MTSMIANFNGIDTLRELYNIYDGATSGQEPHFYTVVSDYIKG